MQAKAADENQLKNSSHHTLSKFLERRQLGVGVAQAEAAGEVCVRGSESVRDNVSEYIVDTH